MFGALLPKNSKFFDLFVQHAALSVDGVLALEKLHLRKAGLGYRATLHVQADPKLSLHDAHALSGKVKWTIRDRVQHVGEHHPVVLERAGEHHVGGEPSPGPGDDVFRGGVLELAVPLRQRHGATVT